MKLNLEEHIETTKVDCHLERDEKYLLLYPEFLYKMKLD